jgi:hypothetical protein
MSIDITTTKGFGTSSLTALVHGPSGAGKTYAARTCPGKTLVVSAEAGLLSLRDLELDVAVVKTFKDLKLVYVMLIDNEAGYEWVYIDSLSEVAEICLAEEMSKTPHGVKAYGEMMTAVMRLVKAFRDLPLNVVFTAKQGRDVDPEGVAYKAADLPGRKLSIKVPYELDLVFGLAIHKDEEGRMHRYFQTMEANGVHAKDRSGALDTFEPPDWAVIHSKISNSPMTGE